MSDANLNPCPICSGEKLRMFNDQSQQPNAPENWIIACPGCFVSFHRQGTQQEFIDVWNNRYQSYK